MMMQPDYEREIQQIKDLPTLPAIFNRLTQLLIKEKTTVKQLTTEIARDQTLTAKILKIVNSAYYGFYRKITDLNDAVALLGFNEVKLLVMGVPVFETFFNSRTDPMERYRFWEHSMLCSITSDVIAAKVGMETKNLSIAGLLHDIGKVVLDRYFHEDWVIYLEQRGVDPRPEIELEELYFGTNHAIIGGLIAEKWNLPENLVECIRFHHNPDTERKFFPETCVVCVSNTLCKLASTGTPPTGNLTFPTGSLQALNLDKESLAAILSKVRPHLKGIKAMLGLRSSEDETN